MVKKWQEELSKWPAMVPDFKIEPSSTALVIIDMQRSMVGEEIGIVPMLRNRFPEVYEYVLPRAKNIVIPNTKKLLDFFREKGLRIVHVTIGPELPDGSDFKPLRRITDEAIGQAKAEEKALHPKGSPYHAIIEELQPKSADELVVNKVATSVFTSTQLDFTLRNIGIDSLIITGCVTHACVETTARDAADKGFKTVLVDDAILGFDQPSHDATMKSFSAIFGKVRDTDEIIKHLSEAHREEGI